MNRGPPIIYQHHEGLRIKTGISKRVVYELSEPKRTAKCAPPPGLHWRCSSWPLWGWCAVCGVRLKSLSPAIWTSKHANAATAPSLSSWHALAMTPACTHVTVLAYGIDSVLTNLLQLITNRDLRLGCTPKGSYGNTAF